ncbi:hypothetical protein BC830DRAFT_1076990 [Chytriomyces sp. MP71]|nr:hypothetical protein BC830DRAFT_1076990 [Chytriomyces sp. MP71]
MPQLKLNTRAQTLTVVPFSSEKLLALSGNRKVTIGYEHIKNVRVRPQETFTWAKGIQTRINKPPVITNAISHHFDRKPDLHLYANPSNTVGIDMEGHPTYGKVFFEVQNHPPLQVAQRILKEVGLPDKLPLVGEKITV